ncbi:MAG: hypothetical protein OXM55_07755 [Bdellovibrionales bacterium]|nr:hypothetical protein [Bdellovibrionales bacterium]
MKIAILFICSFFLYLVSVSNSMTAWAVGYDPSEEVVLTNPEPLPPAEEIIGVIGTPEDVNNRGEEIQLAHGGCQDKICDNLCSNKYGGHIRNCNPDIIIPVPNPSVTAFGNICRGGLGYCYTSIAIVGTPCYCTSYSLFGLPYVWLQGTISTF